MNTISTQVTIRILKPHEVDPFIRLIKLFEEVFVQADEVDDYALDFYRSTKPTEEENVRHFYYAFHQVTKRK